MTANFQIINDVYLDDNKDKLGGIVVFNYHGLNEVLNQFVGYAPTKKDQMSNDNVVGFWKVKTLKTQ